MIVVYDTCTAILMVVFVWHGAPYVSTEKRFDLAHTRDIIVRYIMYGSWVGTVY